MVGMSFAYLSLVLHNSYIYLSIFQHIFCHNSLTAWQILSSITIWAIGPMAHVPAKFHPDIFNIKTKLDNYNYAYNNNNNNKEDKIQLFQDPVHPMVNGIIIRKTKSNYFKIPFPFRENGIIIAKMKPHKNKIPFPFWGNGIISKPCLYIPYALPCIPAISPAALNKSW